MLFKKLALTLIYFFIFLLAQAQKENNIWTFGGGIGINFNTAPPSIYYNAIEAMEGCASICDDMGNLLFYSNGNTVWDNTHTIMPNGTGLLGATSASCTQGTAIAPVFGKPNYYLLFSLEQEVGVHSGYLRYSVIDMNLNGGKGDVISGAKNVILDTNRSEKMVIAQGCNSVWVVTHDIDSPIFYSYKIDAPFMIGPPVVSHTMGMNRYRNYYVGEMKMSPDFKSIAMVNYGPPGTGEVKAKYKIELFDFDKKTGIISNYYLIDSSFKAYSVEFSPDNSKLYVCEFDSLAYQYDLSLLPSTAAVSASKYALSGNHFSSLRRGPDGKLYGVRYGFRNQISRINNPNDAGAACNLVLDEPSLANTNTTDYFILGNNTLYPVEGLDATEYGLFDTVLCAGDLYTFYGKNSHINHKWDDGLEEKDRNFEIPGIHIQYSTKGCTQYYDTVVIKTKPKEYISRVQDTSLCFLKDYLVSPKKGFNFYLWNDSSDAASNTFTETGIKWVVSTNGDCLFEIDTFKVKMVNYDVNIKDTFICNGDRLFFDATVPYDAQYLWNDNSKLNTFSTDKSGFYWVNVQVDECSRKDDFYIAEKSFAVDFENNKYLCEGMSVVLRVLEKNASFLWQDGSTADSFVASKTGTYVVKTTEGNCSAENAVFVDVVKCENCFHIPNTFSPNGDQINDEFKVLTECLVDEFSMQIYNRWGENIFSTFDYNDAWNGTHKGSLLNTGTYFYMVKIKFKKPGAETELHKGDITLIR